MGVGVIDDFDEYNPYEDGLMDGNWAMADGRYININDMDARHIRNAIGYARRAARNATFSHDSDIYEQWVEMFEDELANRRADRKRIAKPAKTAWPSKGLKQLMRCHCGIEYMARVADLNRGWGFSCSKSCAAVRRDFGRPRATKIGAAS